MQFVGDVDRDVCCITFVPVSELEHPVGFDALHAFECESVLRWLRVQRSNPITGLPLPADLSFVLQPLVIAGRMDHVESTKRLIDVEFSRLRREENAARDRTLHMLTLSVMYCACKCLRPDLVVIFVLLGLGSVFGLAKIHYPRDGVWIMGTILLGHVYVLLLGTALSMKMVYHAMPEVLFLCMVIVKVYVDISVMCGVLSVC